MDPTSKGLVHSIAGMADVTVDRSHAPFQIYRAPGAPASQPAVVLVVGYPDPGATAFFGKPLREWASYVEWARLLAASGVTAITYENQTPADVVPAVEQLRAQATELGIDRDRIAVWACSGNAPTALGLIARVPIARAALLYPCLLDVDGTTTMADTVRSFHAAMPEVTLGDLPATTPLLIVRAGADTTPNLDATLQQFVPAARARGLTVDLVEHATGPHAFDLSDPSERSREVITAIVEWLRHSSAR